LNILRKSDEKIKVFLKSDKNNGHFTCRSVYIYDTDSLSYSSNQKCFGLKFQRKLKHALCVQKRFYENCTAYEIRWKIMVEPDWPQVTI